MGIPAGMIPGIWVMRLAAGLSGSGLRRHSRNSLKVCTMFRAAGPMAATLLRAAQRIGRGSLRRFPGRDVRPGLITTLFLRSSARRRQGRLRNRCQKDRSSRQTRRWAGRQSWRYIRQTWTPTISSWLIELGIGRQWTWRHCGSRRNPQTL